MEHVGFLSDQKFGRVFVTLMIFVGAMMAAYSLLLAIRN